MSSQRLAKAFNAAAALPNIKSITNDAITLTNGEVYTRFTKMGQAGRMRKFFADGVESIRKLNSVYPVVDALSDHTYKPYAGIVNGYLRNGSENIFGKAHILLTSGVQKLRTSIDAFSTNSPITTYRATRMKYLPTGATGNILLGARFLDKAFLSTSPIYADSVKFGKKTGSDVILEFLVPPGHGRGAYIESWSHVKHEREMLLRDSTWGRVISERFEKDGMRIVTILVR